MEFLEKFFANLKLRILKFFEILLIKCYKTLAVGGPKTPKILAPAKIPLQKHMFDQNQVSI